MTNNSASTKVRAASLSKILAPDLSSAKRVQARRCTDVPSFDILDRAVCVFLSANIGATMTFTAVYMPVPEGYIGFVEEIPGASSQGETLDEVRENLREAVQLVLEANRELAEQALVGKEVEREPFELAA